MVVVEVVAVVVVNGSKGTVELWSELVVERVVGLEVVTRVVVS